MLDTVYLVYDSDYKDPTKNESDFSQQAVWYNYHETPFVYGRVFFFLRKRPVTSKIPAHVTAELCVNPFTPQSDQFQVSSCSLIRDITSHSMENLAFHSLIR